MNLMKDLYICDRENSKHLVSCSAFPSSHIVRQSHMSSSDQWLGLGSFRSVKICNSSVISSPTTGQATLLLLGLPLAWAHELPRGAEALQTALGMRHNDKKSFVVLSHVGLEIKLLLDHKPASPE